MRKLGRKVWRMFRFPLIAAFGILPLSFLAAALFADKLPAWIWLWPAGYVVLDGLGTRIRGKWRILYGISAATLILCIGSYGIFYVKSILMGIFPVLYLLLFLFGLRMNMAKRNEQMNPLWYQFGMGIHLLCQLLLHGHQPSTNLMLQISFFVFAALVMVTMNQKCLFFASSGRQSPSILMKRKNFLLTVFFWGGAALLSLIPIFATAVMTVCKWAIAGIWKIITVLDFFDLLVETGSSSAGGGKVVVDELPKGEGGFSFPLYYIAACMMLPLGYGVFRAIKVFPLFLRAVLERFSSSDPQNLDDYIDEITDTRKTADGMWASKHKHQMVNRRKLPPNQKIRSRYYRLRVKHQWGNDTTARENLPDAAALLYEKIRYSDYIATEQDVSLFFAHTRRC